VKGGVVMLTVKQEKFCQEYAKCGNATEAYTNAGYSFEKKSTAEVNGCRLLKNAKIKNRLSELAQESKIDSIADIQEMQEVLSKIIRREMCDIGVNSDGEKVQKPAAIKDIINAIEKLGKMQGAFVERIEADVNTETTITIELSDD
jgi:phage terminase small subunit